MYKAGLYYTRSQQNIPHPSLSTPKNPHAGNKFPITEKLDLKKFNEYLQDKISRKVNKNWMKDSKRGEVQGDNYNSIGRYYQRSTPTIQRQRFPQNLQEKDYSSEKVQWKRHQSIEKLLEKENKERENYLRKNYMPQSESNSMQFMEQKYQQLQQKYKKLMQETIISNKQFQQNQKEMQALKQKRMQDQQILIKLKTELMNIQMNESKPTLAAQTESKKVQTTKSHQIIESDVSIVNSQVPQKSWKSKQLQRNELKNSVAYSKGNKTTQSWMSKANTSNVPQFHQPSSRYESKDKSRNYYGYDDRKCNRYFSAEKSTSNTRRNSKAKKNSSDVIQYTEIQSKTTIKFGQSLSNSKIKIPQRYIEHKYEPQKSITPTTLHKKVITSNQYSKYRFQPTVRINDVSIV